MPHRPALRLFATRILRSVLVVCPAAFAADHRDAPAIDPVIEQLLSVATVGDPVVSPHGLSLIHI